MAKMMKKFIICRGISGSGKNFLGEQIQSKLGGVILSTDNYFMNGEKYVFDASRLKDAHQWNFDWFRYHIDKLIETIILCNTCTQWWEIEKYVRYAQAAGYEVEIMEPATPWKFNVEECFKRNSHDVPKEVIQKMLDRWESTESCLQKVEDAKAKKSLV